MKARWLLLTMLATATAFAGQVYSWVDANGVHHFSDSPPPQSTVGVKRLKVQGGITASEDDAGEASGETRTPATALAAAAGYSPEDITRNCASARKNLAMLAQWHESLKPDGTPADPGARDAHAAQVEKAQAQIKLFCGE